MTLSIRSIGPGATVSMTEGLEVINDTAVNNMEVS